MKALHLRIIVLGLLVATSGSVFADPAEDKRMNDILAAMRRSATWGHPDEYGQFNGVQQYAVGHYQAAMKFFRTGARYADKFSQLSIGLMYLNGNGVAKDPVTAYAWIALSTERKYPQFETIRDNLWEQLDPQQREQAKALTETLRAEYGDAVAKPRMEHALRVGLREMTGSRVGFQGVPMASMSASQFFAADPRGAEPPCGAATMDGAPITGCDDIFTPWRWDPKQYFAVRDAAWRGTVTVGELQDANKK